MELPNTIKICNEFGEEKEYAILFTFIYKKDNKKYVVYTDTQKDDKEANIYCSIYSQASNGLNFVEKVNDNEVLEIVDQYIAKYQDYTKDDGEKIYDFTFDEDF